MNLGQELIDQHNRSMKLKALAILRRLERIAKIAADTMEQKPDGPVCFPSDEDSEMILAALEKALEFCIDTEQAYDRARVVLCSDVRAVFEPAEVVGDDK